MMDGVASLLGPDEQAVVHEFTVALESVHGIVEGMRRPHAPLNKMQSAAQERQIRDLLAVMRAKIRDLELLAEEQDT
jgi:hypothetical protein